MQKAANIGPNRTAASQKESELRHCLNVGFLRLRLLSLHLQRMTGIHPSRRNVLGAAIGPLPSAITVKNGPEQPLDLGAANSHFQPKAVIRSID